ncbi:MAG: AAA family ATPase [Deltaproteobacteria bacterium]|nr:AAA family ATPase [Deltaproteobacteria bacterium]
MKCPHCQFESPEGMNFCGKCGQPLSAESAHLLPEYANRSPRDYTPPFLLEKVLVNHTALEGERKHVTVFFADVAGFTTISETLDPEEVHDIMDGCFEILGQEIHGAGGTINQYTGDGVMALFGAPVAYEDHIHRACHAALRVQHRLKGYTRDVKKQYGVLFQMRIGIHAGPVVVGAIGDNLRLDYTAIGDTTNLSARLEALAAPGGILVSWVIQSVAKPFFRFRKEGDFSIKGKKEPVTVFSLLEESDMTRPRETGIGEIPFVDRKKELSVLLRAYKNMLKGRFQMAVLEGEAGVGKTRLLTAFQNTVLNENSLCLQGRCRPYGETTALYPIAQMLRRYFEIAEHDSFKVVRNKIRARIQQRDLIPRLEKIFELLGVNRTENSSNGLFEGEKRRMFRAIGDLLGAIVTRRPLILFFDDMQWADDTTHDFLSFLAQSPIKGPLMVVCSGRTTQPVCRPIKPDHFIQLKPLEDSISLQLFNSVLGSSRLDDRISRNIVSHAGGNPLFLIEMAETIKRQKLMVCDAQICRLRQEVDALEIPQTIRGVLSARLDALPASVKRAAQLAAVIGTEFSHDLLAFLTGDTARLKQILTLLKEEGIIDELSSDSGGKYVFRHQMMQEIAYEGLLKKNRKAYHLVVAKAMEKMYRDNLTEQTGFLAFHYYHAQDWQKAFAYTLEAGDHAKRSYACGEALICFDRALDILKKGLWDHPRERALQIYKWKGGMHFCLGQTDKSYSTFQKMLAEAKHLKDRESEGEALFRLGWTSFFKHKPLSALRFLEKAIDLANQNDLQEILLKAASFEGFVYSVLGDLKKAKPLLIQALDLSEDVISLEGKAWCLSYLIQYYNWTGELGEALAISDELWQLNETLKSPFFHIVLHFRKGLIYGGLGRLKEAEDILQAGLKKLETGDEKFWKPRFLNTLGWIRAEKDEMEEALKLNQEALRLALPTGDPETIHNAEINVGENYLQMGDLGNAENVLVHVRNQIKGKRHLYAGWRYKTRLLIALGGLYAKKREDQKALYFIIQALKMTRKNSSQKHEAMALRVKASIVHKNRPKTARTYMEQAHELSAKMGAKPLLKKISDTMKGFEKP